MERPKGVARKYRVAMVQFKSDTILDLLCIPKEFRSTKHFNEISYGFEIDSFKVKLMHDSFPESYEGEMIPTLHSLVHHLGCLNCGRPMFEYKIPK